MNHQEIAEEMVDKLKDDYVIRLQSDIKPLLNKEVARLKKQGVMLSASSVASTILRHFLKDGGHLDLEVQLKTTDFNVSVDDQEQLKSIAESIYKKNMDGDEVSQVMATQVEKFEEEFNQRLKSQVAGATHKLEYERESIRCDFNRVNKEKEKLKHELEREKKIVSVLLNNLEEYV